jgi:hypothetical protein
LLHCTTDLKLPYWMEIYRDREQIRVLSWRLPTG